MRAFPNEALFVTQYYRPELIGSAPFCSDVAEWLLARGRQMTVLTGRPHYPEPAAFSAYIKDCPRRETINGVAVERLPSWVPRRRGAPHRILAEGLFLLQGGLAIATGRIQRRPLVLSLCPSVLCVALGALATRPGGHHVAIVHDIQSGLAKGLGMVGSRSLLRLIGWCERAALNRADIIVVLAKEMRDRLRDLGVTAPIEVVPIWVDPERVRPMPETGGRAPRLLYSGNFGKKQGLGQILDLAEELQRSRPEIEITLRGGGGEGDALASEIAARDLRNVQLAGLLPSDRLSEGLAAGDIHLVPQDPEAADFAVPSKIFNIMAVGRPFVTTARAGSSLWRLREKSDAFLCVPPYDSTALVRAVLRLVDDEELRVRLGRRGRHFVERYYAKPKVLGDFVRLIDGLYVRQ